MSDIAVGDQPLVHPDVQHETSDVQVRGIIWFGVGLAVFLAVVHMLMAGMFVWFDGLQRQQSKQLPPLAKRERAVFPKDLNRIPGPRLQESEVGDMQRLRQEEEAKLNRKTAGLVPIDEALKQMADPRFAAKYGIRARPAAETARMQKLEQAWKRATESRP